MCQSRSVCCVPAPSDIIEEVGLLCVRLTCTIHCKVCESWLMCGYVAMIQHEAKLNSLLVAQPHFYMNFILYNSEDEIIVCV